MTETDTADLQLPIGATGSVWCEVIGYLDQGDVPCDFCNHEGSTAERGTINADYILKIGHSGCAYICDYCIDGDGDHWHRPDETEIDVE